MPAITLPVLLLVRRGIVRPSQMGDGDKRALAFSSVEKAVDFMRATGESNWEFSLVIRAGLTEVADCLEAAGLSGLCIDPLIDEIGGDVVSLAELRALGDC